MHLLRTLSDNRSPLALCLAYMAVFLQPLAGLGPAALWSAWALAAAAAAVAAWRRRGRPTPWAAPLGFALLGFGLGLVCLGALVRQERSQYCGLDPRRVAQATVRLEQDALRGRDGWRAVVRVESVADGDGVRTGADLRAMAYFPADGAWFAGARLELAGVALKPVADRPYAWQLSGAPLEVRPPPGPDGARACALAGCEAALAGLPADLRGFVLALLLGRQDELDPDMRQAFYGSGCAHLVALSGMHIAVVAALLVRLARPLLGVAAARVAGGLGAAAFIWLAGPFPSALRALVMFGLLQAGALRGRRLSAVAALCLSGPALGLLDPGLPLSLGYQLSFWALLGIMLCQAGLHAWLRRPLLPLLSLELSTGVAAQLCTAPLLWLRGLPFYPQGVVAGALLAPLVLLFMALSAAALALGLAAGPAAAACLAPLLDPIYRLILAIGAAFAGGG